MSQAILELVKKPFIKQNRPEIRSGYTVRVHQKIKEGEKERVQIFEGLVIKLNSGNGTDKSFTVRKIVQGIGVEKTFPMYSPNIIKIQVIKKGKVRQSKIYYMRERSGKRARMTEEHVFEEDILEEPPKDEQGDGEDKTGAAETKADGDEQEEQQHEAEQEEPNKE